MSANQRENKLNIELNFMSFEAYSASTNADVFHMLAESGHIKMFKMADIFTKYKLSGIQDCRKYYRMLKIYILNKSIDKQKHNQTHVQTCK